MNSMPVIRASEPLYRRETAMLARNRGLLLVSAAMIVAINVFLFLAMQHFHSRQPDFSSLYQRGRAIIHEDFPAIIHRFPALNGTDYMVETPNGPFPPDTMHPPYELLIFVGLAFFKSRIAYPLWWGCNLVLLGFAAYLLSRHVSNLQSRFHYLLFLIATFFPVFVALVQGQTTVLLLVLLILSFDSLEAQRDFRAGFFLAMGMSKFVLIIPMVFLLVLERRWRSLAGFAAGCVALFLVALSLVGLGGIAAYVRLVAGYGRAAPEQAGTEAIMPNLRGLVHVFAAWIVPGAVLTMLTLVLTVALIWWVDGRITKCSNASLRFSAQVLLAIMVSYHLYPHDATILIIPVMILLNHAMREGVGRRFKRIVFLCAAFIYFTPLVAPLNLGMPIIGIASLVLLTLERSAFQPTPVLMVTE